MTFTTYYVLNGLLDGEWGVRAMRAGGGTDADVLADGHYWMEELGEAIHGPYLSRNDAVASAKIATAPLQSWLVQHGSPSLSTEPFREDDANEWNRMAHKGGYLGFEVEYLKDDDEYECTLVKEDCRLSMKIAAEDHRSAARVFSAAAIAQYNL